MTEPITVVLAEDAVLLREGMVRLLDDSGFKVLSAAGDADQFLRDVEHHQPQLVVADVRMPPTFTDEGIKAALVVRKEFPETSVLVLSQYVETEYAKELLADTTGGVGYLLKDRVADVAEFLETLTRVVNGGTALDPEVVSQLLAGSSTSNPVATLTPREHEVLAKMAEGLTNTAIASQLVVTEGAVEKHVSNIFNKLGLHASGTDHRRVQAVLRYLDSVQGC